MIICPFLNIYPQTDSGSPSIKLVLVLFFHGIPWNSMESQFPGKYSMEFHGNPCPNTPWNSMENIPTNFMELHGIPWRYLTRDIRLSKLIIVYSKIPLKNHVSINFMIQPGFRARPSRALFQCPVETHCTHYRSANKIYCVLQVPFNTSALLEIIMNFPWEYHRSQTKYAYKPGGQWRLLTTKQLLWKFPNYHTLPWKP